MINNLIQNKFIINYHRISNENIDDPLSVSIKTFENQIKLLNKEFSIVSLDKIIEKKSNNKKYLAITFDDGYKDNLFNAIPILEKYNAPATIYVTTRFLEGKCEMWWYELKKFLGERDTISFEFNNKHYLFNLETDSLKNKSFEKISFLFKKLKYDDQNYLLQVITNNKNRIQYRNEMLNADDLMKIKDKTIITLGAHTHNHISLAHFDKNECLNEIKTSKNKIENIINQKVNHFAYPYGGNEDIGNKDPDLVKSAGFTSAVTTQINLFENYQNYLLPRIYISEKDVGKLLILKLSFIYKVYYFLRFRLFKFF